MVEISKEVLCRGSVSAAVGAVLGIVISLIVNCTLVEISISPFFSWYFGALFILVGLMIMWRILGQGDGTSPQEEPRGSVWFGKMQLTFFAVMIVLSGLLCFVLEKNSFISLSSFTKIPLYSILGISVAFALTFSIVDFINYLLGFLRASAAKPLVESKSQVSLVLVVALVMGGLFGFIFGALDIEDEYLYHIRLALQKEERMCYPIGAILGGLAGFGNEYIRDQEECYHKRLGQSEFDDDI